MWTVLLTARLGDNELVWRREDSEVDRGAPERSIVSEANEIGLATHSCRYGVGGRDVGMKS